MALEIMSIGGHKIMKLRTSITAICLSVFIAALATTAHAADEPLEPGDE
ncbi:hypothetical protein J2Y68_001053 [Paenarthrobacter nitroguajacolicus]|nr:hypothetical protein [Paenarthrobacter nitroguajacolicus]